MKHVILVAFLFLFVPVFSQASGTAPTGCAIVLERIDDVSFLATSYAVEDDPDALLLITPEDCVERIAEFEVTTGDIVVPDSFDVQALEGVSVGEQIAVPVDQIWSSPGEDGSTTEPGYAFDYYRTFSVETVELTEDEVISDQLIDNELVNDPAENTQTTGQENRRSLQMRIIDLLQKLVSLLQLQL